MMTMQEKIRDGLSYVTIENPIKLIVMIFVVFVAPVLTRQWLLDSQSLLTTIPLIALWVLGVLMHLAAATAALTSTVFTVFSFLSEEFETSESTLFSIVRIILGSVVFLSLSKVILYLLTARW
jgi:hypothetical protein